MILAIFERFVLYVNDYVEEKTIFCPDKCKNVGHFFCVQIFLLIMTGNCIVKTSFFCHDSKRKKSKDTAV